MHPGNDSLPLTEVILTMDGDTSASNASHSSFFQIWNGMHHNFKRFMIPHVYLYSCCNHSSPAAPAWITPAPLTTSASIFSKYNMLTWSFTIDSSLQVYNQRCVLQISTFAIMLRRYIQYQQLWLRVWWVPRRLRGLSELAPVARASVWRRVKKSHYFVVSCWEVICYVGGNTRSTCVEEWGGRGYDYHLLCRQIIFHWGSRGIKPPRRVGKPH